MKKSLLLCFAAMALFACKKNVSVDDPTPLQNSGEQILLSAGGPLSRVANQGVRDTLFETGDQIGVIGAFADFKTPFAPRWDTVMSFDNSPACFDKNDPTPGVDSKSFSLFTWGAAAGTSTIADIRYYPAKKRGLFLYAYYPYTSVGTEYIKPDGLTTHPALAVTLKDGVINGTPATDVNHLQPDVLYYAGAAMVKSDLITKPFVFKHGLAQLQFRLRRTKGSAECRFDSIIFKTIKSGNMNITDGTFSDYGTVKTEAVYKIVPVTAAEATAITVPEWEKEGDPMYSVLDIPLMIFPLADADARLGSLRVVCDYAKKGASGKELIGFDIDLSTLKDAYLAGQLNVFNITVSKTAIKLEAKIEPWKPDGTVSNLPAE